MKILKAAVTALYAPQHQFMPVFRRRLCAENGHVAVDAEIIEKLCSEKHPASDRDVVYSVHILRCPKCGSVFDSPGLRWRDGALERCLSRAKGE